jgi:membrane-anchored glycerophosphoryl diester phosphodiesterase (GDPDase)
MISHGIYIERVGFSSDFHRSISIAHLLVMGLMCSVYIKVLYVKEKKLLFILNVRLLFEHFKVFATPRFTSESPGDGC